ncbi:MULTISPECIES: hypothetical protein [unclassified Streptomyces]|uniref:WXG100-like domain-containing protein n=1 Tax=unclassified Streptomyces TaxID=2593676 RepID=UPI00224DBCB9|nr:MULTISPECIES: hypothetical protein [unclassified Streptomyces]MCX4406004.1 hypothetical protein [Streptomyces sp. NBC_01764]MCX5189472.1 hypothetical protein [Streptomyces sp. NBC_00268]
MDTIELPGALAWLAPFVIGDRWPKVKEGLLWELGELDQEAARRLAEILDALRRVIPGAAANATGPAGDAMTDLLDRLSVVIPDLVETATALGDSAKSTATEIQYGKLMIIGVMIWLAAELAALLPWSWVPGVSGLIEAVEAAAAVVARTLLGRVLRSVAARASFSRALQAAGAASASRIAQLLERLGVEKGVARSVGELGGRMVNGALAGTAFNVGLDVGIQAGQMAAGTRQSWNAQSTAFGALTGVAGGLLGAGLIHGVQSAVGRLGEKFGARRADAEGLAGAERVIRVAGVRAEMTGWVAPPAVTRPAWKAESFAQWKSAAGLRSLPARAAVGGVAGLPVRGGPLLGRRLARPLVRVVRVGCRRARAGVRRCRMCRRRVWVVRAWAAVRVAPGSMSAVRVLPRSDAAAAGEPGTPAEVGTTEPFVPASESVAVPSEVSSADTAAAATAPAGATATESPTAGATAPETPTASAGATATAGYDGFVPSQDQGPGGGQGAAVAGDPWDIAAGSLLLPLFGPGSARTTENEADERGAKTSSYHLRSESGIWEDDGPVMPTWRPDATGAGAARAERDEGEVSMSAAMRRIEEARQRISQSADEDAARAAEAEKEAEEEADNTREEGLRPTAVAHLLRQGDSQWGGSRGSDLFG